MSASQAESREFESRLPLQCSSVKRSQTFTSQLLDGFIRSRASGTSRKYVVLIHLALDKFVGHALTPESINDYLDNMTCGNGKHNYYRIIKTLCRWLYHTGQLEQNIIEFVKAPKRQKKLLSAITQNQLDVLIDNASCERDKVVLTILWRSGMRRSECANVTREDFDFDKYTARVLGKGNRVREVYVGNGIVKDWFTEHNSLELNSYGIQTMLRRLSDKTGIHCNAHSFRRGFCTDLVKRGLSNKVIQSLGGWETPAMVSHYAASLTFDDALAVYNKVVDAR
jgi:site-specific recombinase XerD